MTALANLIDAALDDCPRCNLVRALDALVNRPGVMDPGDLLARMERALLDLEG